MRLVMYLCLQAPGFFLPSQSDHATQLHPYRRRIIDQHTVSGVSKIDLLVLTQGGDGGVGVNVGAILRGAYGGVE